MADIELPQLGETVTEGTITKWFKDVGDEVAEDEPLFEVSTDKVDSEVPSPAGGYLAEIKIGEGETVDVGTVLAVLSDTAPASGGGDDGGAPAEAEATEEPAVEESTAAEPAAEPEPAAPGPQPEPAPAAAEPQPATEPQPAATGSADAPATGTAGSGLLLSPVVRRMVNDNGLDPSTIEGSGPGGRITRSDVEAAVARGGEGGRDGGRGAPAPATRAPAPAPAAAPARAAAAQSQAPVPTAGEGDRVEALNNIRRRTGEHMVRSKATSPHVLTVVEVDYEGVERVRSAHKARFRDEEGIPLTYLGFVARALVDALDDFPYLNASVGDGELIVHEAVNLGIAVDLDFQGLIVPVIANAQDLRLAAIARQVHDLAERARTKKLSADDITGGTVSITNAGGYGTSIMGAIINQPQVMVLSTDGVSRKPVVVTAADGTEAIAIHSVGNLCMSWDHRAFDGAYASAFLQRLREIIETRDWEAEL